MADLARIYRKEGRDAEAEPLSVKILEVRRRAAYPRNSASQHASHDE